MGETPQTAINPILNLLGTEYEVNIRYDKFSTAYVVRVNDRDYNYAEQMFRAINAEFAWYDVLLFTIEICIKIIKENVEHRD